MCQHLYVKTISDLASGKNFFVFPRFIFFLVRAARQTSSPDTMHQAKASFLKQCRRDLLQTDSRRCIIVDLEDRHNHDPKSDNIVQSATRTAVSPVAREPLLYQMTAV